MGCAETKRGIGEEGEPGGDRVSAVESIRPPPVGPPPAGPPPPARSAPDPDSPTMIELGIRRGVVIDDTYRIVGPLGAGGMGVVTLARDERLDRLVAIKFIRPELFKDDGLRRYFVTEARAMARVSHANVLAVHAFGEHGRVPYFVMEYLEGPTVEEWLARRPPGLPAIGDAIRILDQACQGVEAIHAASTVHRDLKPSNLLMSAASIDEQLRVAVSDLGVARILEQAGDGPPCCIVGSAQYMAPEAALGDDSRPDLATRRDVYALGCIAYELLTGRPPFEAPTDMSLMAKQLLEAPPAPRALRPDLPAGYDDVLLRAVEKDPHARWPSADAFRRALLAVHERDQDPRRILVVDDDPDWRELLRASLSPRFPDAEIEVVENGAAAIRVLEERPCCAVLVDLEMPSVDGMELTTWLRGHERGDATPIIVLTAAGGPSEWRRLSGMGADAFLVKPVDADDVAMVVRRTLRRRRER